MASVYKRGGKKNRHGRYIASFHNEHGKRVDRSTGTTDYDAACQIAAKLETDAALRKQGVIDASQSRFAEQNQRPLSEHVAEYLAHCEHVGQNRVHVANKRAQLDKLIAGIGASRLSDLEPNKVERYLASLIKAGKSHRTHNQHRATVVTFAEWCWEQGRIASNPLKIVPALNEAKDRRRVRRAMTEDELSRLLAASVERCPYYLFAYYTGLRVKAVKAAVWGDVDFDAATIRVRVGNAKGKKDDTFYNLHPRIVDELKRIRPPFASPLDRVFSVPIVRTFHRDCERAGVERYDAEGRQLDRHALRTTLGTHLARAGVLPQQAMKVLGHTDVRITMKHYTDLRLADTAKAVQSLPSIQPKANPLMDAAALLATGTDNATANVNTPQPPLQQIRQQTGGVSGQGPSLSGNAGKSVKASIPKMAACISHGKINGFGTTRHGEPSSDLMLAAPADIIAKSRAIGAVG
jgi:integrase